MQMAKRRKWTHRQTDKGDWGMTRVTSIKCEPRKGGEGTPNLFCEITGGNIGVFGGVQRQERSQLHANEVHLAPASDKVMVCKKDFKKSIIKCS